MADAKVTALDELTAVESTDLLYVVDDPGGTAASKKATVQSVGAVVPFPGPLWRPKSGLYVGTGVLPLASSAKTIDVTYPNWGPLLLWCSMTFDQIIIEIKDTGTGRNIKYGVWASAADLTPSICLIDSGEVSTDTSGTKTVTLDPAVTLPAGLYWAGCYVSANTSIECISTLGTLSAGQYGSNTTNSHELTGTGSYPAGALADNPLSGLNNSTANKAPWIRLRQT